VRGKAGKIAAVFAPENYLDLERTEHRVIFENVESVWQALPKIAAYLKFRLKPAINGKLIGKPFVSNAVFVGRGTIIEHGAMIKGPAWIGENCEIRNGCYIRENVIMGNGVVAGNSSEFKNCLIFDKAEVPHFNYVGDSILGHKAHLGAGVILSNYRLDHGQVVVRDGDETLATGLRKMGAILGDAAEIGCNSVLNPGSIIGRCSIIYPLSSFGGVLPAHTLLKTRSSQMQVPRT